MACGVGQNVRTRTCSDPWPECGGLECGGQAEDSMTCDTGIDCISSSKCTRSDNVVGAYEFLPCPHLGHAHTEL